MFRGGNIRTRFDLLKSNPVTSYTEKGKKMETKLRDSILVTDSISELCKAKDVDKQSDRKTVQKS